MGMYVISYALRWAHIIEYKSHGRLNAPFFGGPMSFISIRFICKLMTNKLSGRNNATWSLISALNDGDLNWNCTEHNMKYS